MVQKFIYFSNSIFYIDSLHASEIFQAFICYKCDDYGLQI